MRAPSVLNALPTHSTSKTILRGLTLQMQQQYGNAFVMKLHTVDRKGRSAPSVMRAADPDEVAIASKHLHETPTTNAEYAAWVLKAHDLGFVKFTYRAKPDLKNLRDGKKAGKADPSGAEILPALLIMHDVVRDRIRLWLKNSTPPKPTITLGSFATGTDKGKVVSRSAPHHGRAIDINELGFDHTVDGVIDVLESLSTGTYRIGLPFQGDFFDPANHPTKAKPAPDRIVLAFFVSGVWKQNLDPKTKKWTLKKIAGERASKHLRSTRLKAKFHELRKSGVILESIFPDKKGHVHIQRQK